MLKMFVRQTQTVAMASAKDSGGTRRKLDAAVDRAVERHEAEWERNLVSSWGSLNSAEVAGACKALGQHDQAQFTKYAERVGSSVQSKNEPVLKQAATEVLAEVWH